MKEDFVLPTEWAVKITKKNRQTLIDWVRSKPDYSSKYESDKRNLFKKGFFVTSDCRDGSYQLWTEELHSYPEITFDQFKKHVLGMEEKQKQKEIVGWKLKDEFVSCRDAALKLCGTIGNWENSLMEYDISVSQTKYMNKLKQAGVLDLWFTPVYANETPQITINGYKGEFFYNYVKFGCAKIQKEIFISLSKHIGHTFEYTNREIESVTIGKGTFTKEQIKEIAEFYLNKK